MIVKMEKISIIGIDQDKGKIIEDLMDLGVVEISTQEAKLADDQWAEMIICDNDEETALAYDAQMSRAAAVLDTLEQYSDEKKPLFKTRRPIQSQEYHETLKTKSNLSECVDAVHQLTEQLNHLKADENRIHGIITSLEPWEKYDLDLELSKTNVTHVLMGTLPIVSDPEALRAELNKSDCEALLQVVHADSELHYISVIYHQVCEESVFDILKAHGYTQVFFKDLKGTPVENISSCKKQLDEIEDRRTDIENQIKDHLEDKGDIELYHDSLSISRDRAKIRNRLLTTDRAFYLDGYVPCESAPAVKEKMDQYDTFIEMIQIEKGEEFPVLLKNNALVTPFEAITDLYSVPRSTEIDPTPFFAIFYLFFYGMMFSDGGYGVVMAVACFIVLHQFRLEGMPKKLVTMLGLCGISTAIWGALFGGWFGDIVEVVGRVFFGAEVQVPAIWFAPLDDPMKLLLFSLALGVIHLFVGMGIKAYLMIRDGDIIGAVSDVFSWYLVVAGGIVLLAGNMLMPDGPLFQVGLAMVVAGVAILLLTKGRGQKNIFKRVFKGVASLYDVTDFLSLILSYSRLLALGLSTGVVASVVNLMGTLTGDGILGAIVLLVVFVVGHAFNFAINALGAFVHASRLQYVEFFGRFYEGGGTAFEPFVKKTKYIDII